MIRNPIPPGGDPYLGMENKASQPGGYVTPVTDKLWNLMNAIKKNNKGISKTFVPSGDGTPKIMYEGQGLKKMRKKEMFNKSAQELPAIAQRQAILQRQSAPPPLPITEEAEKGPAAEIPSTRVPLVSPEPAIPLTPGQQIMQGIMQQQQLQYELKMKSIREKAMTGPPLTFAEVLKARYAQQAAQEEMAEKSISQQEAIIELQKLMPKQMMQDSEQTLPIDNYRKQYLEELYNLALKIHPAGPPTIPEANSESLYEQNTRPFTGQFINPNDDKIMRPLGDKTTAVPAL